MAKKYLANFKATVKSIILFVKTAVAPFCALFGKSGLFLIPTSGHSASFLYRPANYAQIFTLLRIKIAPSRILGSV